MTDLGALDIERGRDHGMPSYNALRRAYGLAPKSSFTAITGETTDRFPDDPRSTPPPARRSGHPRLRVPAQRVRRRDPARQPGGRAAAVSGVRRTTLAARLRGDLRDVGQLDAFVGMVAERHIVGPSSASSSSRSGRSSSRTCATATASSTRPTASSAHRTALWDLLPANPGAGDRDEHAGRRPAQRLPRGLSPRRRRRRSTGCSLRKRTPQRFPSESRSFSSGSRLSGTVERRTAVAVDDYGTVKRMRCRVPASTRS